MNKKTFFVLYIKSQLPVLFLYVFTLLLLMIMNYSYSLPDGLIIDVFRYSILLLLIWLFAKLIIDIFKIKKFNNDDLDNYKFSTPLEFLMNEKIIHQKSDYVDEINKINFTQKDRMNQMDLSAHEIKNDLTTLRICIENNDYNYDKMFNSINGADYHLNILLNYERLFTDSNDFDFEWIYLDNLVKNILQSMSMQFINKQLVPNLKNLHVEILGDKKWLYFCIEQIISNAIKYSDKNTKIIISFKHDSLFIKDTGETISKSDLPRIFDKGFTGQNGHNQKSSTGIGLFLVKSVCHKLNIKVNSISEEKNTSFILTFKKSMIRL
ncbi:sensor histidine kinase [Apilactobacillus apisilvae]|uniref:histidine kinase n=1 Tax=Apilactobacillus apisilvae TaxID=2923364 RepID=A0ABY4PG78_9LACO|nr:sensor histidine kinase [Apilactobacillus apisilvae]UQS84592.1 sensor histidine kinase [Apilactobacillus apisilvae]